MNEKHCEDLLAGYTLDCLDGGDRATAERHVAECPECRQECEELRAALHDCLGHAAASGAAPSPLVRTQFLARVALEMGAAGATVPGRAAAPRRPILTIEEPPPPVRGTTPPLAGTPQRPYWWMLGGAAVPAVLALVFGVMVMQTRGQLNDQQQASVLATPHVTMPLRGSAVSHGMNGEVIMPQRGMSGLMLVAGMRAPSAGTQYTCWVHRKDGGWADMGVLTPDASGIAMLVFDRATDLHRADRIGVTMERGAHFGAPSGPMVLSSTL